MMNVFQSVVNLAFVLRSLCIISLFLCGSLYSQDIQEDLDAITFDDLMDISVVSFDGTPKKWKKTPAAIHVISKEDIAASAARNIPDLLRGVPGMQVAQMDSYTWAISARGFNRRFANKLLVLIDGRSVYSPLFSGVHWDMHNVPLANIERIEIIRGPGGSLWGANAVNGVINIITKSAADTKGSYLSLGGGSYHKAFGTYRYGELLADHKLAYRITLNSGQTSHMKRSDGSNNPDDISQLRLSSRVDWEPDALNKFTFEAGSYSSSAERASNFRATDNSLILTHENDIDSYQHYFLANWDRYIDERNSFNVQTYYDQYKREDVDRYLKIKTFDLELRYIHDLSDIQKLTFGGGYRIIVDDINNSEVTRFIPEKTQHETYRLFLQDEIGLIKNELTLILGSKYERNSHTGTEWQPSAKLIWTPNNTHSVWGSIARAVRTPSRADEDLQNRIRFAGPTELITQGDRGLESERLISYELGYRYTPENKPYSADFTVFYNDYNHLLGIENVANGVVITDAEEGYTIGAEAFASYRLTDKWKVSASYTFIDLNITGGTTFLGGTPQHSAALKSNYSLTEKISFSQNLYYTDYYNSHREEYSNNYKLDLGFKWQISNKLSLSAWGLNLLEPQSLEFADAQSPAAEVPRSFYIQLEYNF